MNSQNSIGTVLLFLLIAKTLNPAPQPAVLAKDFHRMVGIMGRVDSLGQMALKPPPQAKPHNTATPPAQDSLINASALPDLSGLMDMLGPIVSSFGKYDE